MFVNTLSCKYRNYCLYSSQRRGVGVGYKYALFLGSSGAAKSNMRVYLENTETFFKVILLKQPTRIYCWAFTLILTFSHPGRRNYFILLFIFFPRPLVGEGQGEGRYLFSLSSSAAKSNMRVYPVKLKEKD